MRYVVFGMGGVGASVFERLALGGRDVTGIARGTHLAALRRDGLVVNRLGGEPSHLEHVDVSSPDEYNATPDVVFVCVKGYSLESVYPFLERVCDATTVIIPLLNVYGTGERISEHLSATMGADAPICASGCIYVSAELTEPGVLLEHAPICRIFFGLPVAGQTRRLEEVASDATVNGVECILSPDIRRDTLAKFSYVSPMGATAIIHGSTAGDVQHDPLVRATFEAAVREVVAIGEATGVAFGKDMVAMNLAICDAIVPSATTSMQRDLEAGRNSEFDGLIEEVIRMGASCGVDTPTYHKAEETAQMRFGIPRT